MDEFDYGTDGSGGGITDLITSLANNATQAYETTQALNANPLNTALIYGGTAQTAQGASAAYAAPVVPGIGGSGLLLLLGAAAVIIYAATR